MSSPPIWDHPLTGLGGCGSCSRPLHPVGIGNRELNQAWIGKRYVVPPIWDHPRPGLGGRGAYSRPLLPVGIGNIELNQMGWKALFCPPYRRPSPPWAGWAWLLLSPPFFRWVLAI
jgi:hypothetical protein